jgi:rhamnulose-1-phosphate aldolase
LVSEFELPQSVPELAGATFLVSGSGRRLREIIEDPTANVACVVVGADGSTGNLYTSYGHSSQRVTSEFNSHLAVHYDQMISSGTNFHSIIHAQPLNLTYLSHIPCYQDENYLNTHLLRWQPETILNMPEGFGFIPFHAPSSTELMKGNVQVLRKHRIAVWAKHGVMARSGDSLKHAVDLIEYAETAAKYEYLNLSIGEIGEGLSAAEVRDICQTFKIKQSIF